MTKSQIERLIELSSLVPSGCLSSERYDELAALQVEFEAWDPEAVPPESEEVTLLYEALFSQSDGYRESLKSCTKNWQNICRYYHERCAALEAELKDLRAGIPVPEAPP